MQVIIILGIVSPKTSTNLQIQKKGQRCGVGGIIGVSPYCREGINRYICSTCCTPTYDGVIHALPCYVCHVSVLGGNCCSCAVCSMGVVMLTSQAPQHGSLNIKIDATYTNNM